MVRTTMPVCCCCKNALTRKRQKSSGDSEVALLLAPFELFPLPLAHQRHDVGRGLIRESSLPDDRCTNFAMHLHAGREAGGNKHVRGAAAMYDFQQFRHVKSARLLPAQMI